MYIQLWYWICNFSVFNHSIHKIFHVWNSVYLYLASTQNFNFSSLQFMASFQTVTSLKAYVQKFTLWSMMGILTQKIMIMMQFKPKNLWRCCPWGILWVYSFTHIGVCVFMNSLSLWIAQIYNCTHKGCCRTNKCVVLADACL